MYDELGEISESEGEDEEEGLMMGDRAEREMEEGRKQAGAADERRLASVASGSTSRAQRREAQDPWSAREDEIFGLGGDDDDEFEPGPAARRRNDQDSGPL